MNKEFLYGKNRVNLEDRDEGSWLKLEDTIFDIMNKPKEYGVLEEKKMIATALSITKDTLLCTNVDECEAKAVSLFAIDKMKNLTYQLSEPCYHAVLEGAMDALAKKFPPFNPYAPIGVMPGDEDKNPLGAAWFYGYWEVSRIIKKEETSKDAKHPPAVNVVEQHYG